MVSDVATQEISTLFLLFVIIDYLTLFHRKFCLHVSLCTMCVHMSTHRDQKKALDPLELELQMVVSYHVHTGN